jgi:hypothetical protein
MNEMIVTKLTELALSPTDFTLLVDNEYVTRIEDTLLSTLPRTYKEFLCRYSVGLMPVTYPLIDLQPSARETIEIFYGASSDPIYDLLVNINEYRNRMPKTVIPIGSDAGGNQICLGISGTVRDKVYFWEFEKEVVDGEPDFSNMRLISHSFEAFILSMNFLTFGR